MTKTPGKPSGAAPKASALDLDAALDQVEQHPEGIPARLLRAAVREFAKGGLDTARTHAIAAEAGVAVGSLHFHWRDKRTLFEAACLSASRHYARALAEAVGSPASGTLAPAVMIERFVDAMVELLSAQPELSRLLLYRFAARDSIGDTDRHVADMRLMESVLKQHFPKSASKEVDTPLLILMTYFGSLVIFAASDIQAAYLGSAPADPAFRERFRRFATALLQAALQG